jgi:hypothetical protein
LRVKAVTAVTALQTAGHCRHEAVAAAGEGLDVERRLRVVAEGGARLEHAEVQAALEVDERAVVPDLLPQLLARHQLARTARQREQKPERLGRERHELAIAAQLAGGRVERERAELEHLSSHRTPI